MFIRVAYTMDSGVETVKREFYDDEAEFNLVRRQVLNVGVVSPQERIDRVEVLDDGAAEGREVVPMPRKGWEMRLARAFGRRGVGSKQVFIHGRHFSVHVTRGAGAWAHSLAVQGSVEDIIVAVTSERDHVRRSRVCVRQEHRVGAEGIRVALGKVVGGRLPRGRMWTVIRGVSVAGPYEPIERC